MLVKKIYIGVLFWGLCLSVCFGQRLVQTFEAAKGELSSDRQLAMACNICSKYDFKNVIELFEISDGEVVLREVIYTEQFVEPADEIKRLWISDSLDVVGMVVSDDSSPLLIGSLVILKKINNIWSIVYVDELSYYINSEHITLLSSGDYIVMTKVGPLDTDIYQSISTTLLKYNGTTSKYEPVDERAKQVELAGSVLTQTVDSEASVVWIGLSSSYERRYLTYQILDDLLLDVDNPYETGGVQHSESYYAASEKAKIVIESKSIAFPLAEQYVGTVLTVYTNKGVTEQLYQYSKPRYVINGLSLSEKGNAMMAGYRYGPFGDTLTDTIAMVEYCSIDLSGRIRKRYSFSFDTSEGEGIKGNVWDHSISGDGRYVLVNNGTSEQRLYDMSNFLQDGTTTSEDQRTVLFPNPAFESHIEIANPHYGYVSYSIYNPLKQLLSYGDYPEDNRIPIDVLNSGTYVLVLEYIDGYNEVVKFVVQR